MTLLDTWHELDETTRREVRALLAFEEDAGGGLMSSRFAPLRLEMSVDEAISYLRRQAAHVETIYYAYALDDSQRLLGVVSFRDLFSADAGRAVRDVMQTNVVTAGPADAGHYHRGRYRRRGRLYRYAIMNSRRKANSTLPSARGG